jgi:hypothetical protein
MRLETVERIERGEMPDDEAYAYMLCGYMPMLYGIHARLGLGQRPEQIAREIVAECKTDAEPRVDNVMRLAIMGAARSMLRPHEGRWN